MLIEAYQGGRIFFQNVLPYGQNTRILHDWFIVYFMFRFHKENKHPPTRAVQTNQRTQWLRPWLYFHVR